MKLLLVKLTSLGDLVHVLPALTDASTARPDIEVDWATEEGFAPIAALHPVVRAVIPVALRRWRRRPLDRHNLAEAAAFVRRLRADRYDLALDAQGLIKSAFVMTLARADQCVGFDMRSAREPIAAAAYDRGLAVPRSLHAVDRLRALFASALGYPEPKGAPEFGLTKPAGAGRTLVFLHGTTWANKRWPEPFWKALAGRANSAGFDVLLPWGDVDERVRAERIAAGIECARVAPPMALDTIVGVLASARGVVTVDSGLGHLAAAYGVPTIALYGPTDATLTGCRGARARSVAAEFACAPCRRRTCSYRGDQVLIAGSVVEPPCFATLTPDRVWAQLEAIL